VFKLVESAQARWRVVTGSELFAAWQASGAPSVIGASALAPANPAVRAALPAIGGVLRLPGLAGFATRRLARITTTTAKERPRRSSWGRARVGPPLPNVSPAAK
jgi:hypothetical protein